MLSQLKPVSLSSLWRLVSQPTALCTGLAAYATWRAVYALWFSPLRKIPGPFLYRISDLPMLAIALWGRTSDKMISNYKKYGSLFLMAGKVVAVCDPKDCRLILATHAFRKDVLYAHIDFMEPNMIFTRDPEVNKQRRRQVGPALSPAGLRKMEPIILAAGVQQLLDKWNTAIEQSSSGRAKVCYDKDFLVMTFDVIGSLGFGMARYSLIAGDMTVVRWVRQTIYLILVHIVTRGLKWLPFSHLLIKFMCRDVDEFFAFANQSIDERKQLVANGAAKPNDILQAYIDAEDPESKIKMTPSQVTSEVVLIFLAGADTSSSTLTWTIHLLMLHPQHYKRVIDEVRSSFDKDHLITFDEAKGKLPFLEACVYESLRMRPVTSFLPRVVPPGGVTLQGHFIPEGSACVVNIPCANMNKDAWDEPHVFNPERFIDNEENKRNILTFSSGVRICPGRHLAWLEMLVTLANLFNNYDFALPEDALFTPDNLDKHGRPVVMPRKTTATNEPEFPDRDCQVIISKRQN